MEAAEVESFGTPVETWRESVGEIALMGDMIRSEDEEDEDDAEPERWFVKIGACGDGG